MRSDTAGATFNFRVQELTGTTVVATRSATKTLSTGWQQVTLSFPGTAGRALSINGYRNQTARGTASTPMTSR